MSKTSLYPMKELKIIANAKDLSYLTDLLDRHTTGYTILDYISGKGHHGFHKGHSLFNETAGSRMFIAVLPEEKLDYIFAGLKILLEDKEVVLFISDVSVIREEYFQSQKV